MDQSSNRSSRRFRLCWAIISKIIDCVSLLDYIFYVHVIMYCFNVIYWAVTAQYWITERNSVKNYNFPIYRPYKQPWIQPVKRCPSTSSTIGAWFHSRNIVRRGNTLIQHPNKIWQQWLTALFGQMPLCKYHTLTELSWPKYSTRTSLWLVLVDPLTLDQGWEAEATGLYKWPNITHADIVNYLHIWSIICRYCQLFE